MYEGRDERKGTVGSCEERGAASTMRNGLEKREAGQE